MVFSILPPCMYLLFPHYSQLTLFAVSHCTFLIWLWFSLNKSVNGDVHLIVLEHKCFPKPFFKLKSLPSGFIEPYDWQKKCEFCAVSKTTLSEPSTFLCLFHEMHYYRALSWIFQKNCQKRYYNWLVFPFQIVDSDTPCYLFQLCIPYMFMDEKLPQKPQA